MKKSNVIIAVAAAAIMLLCAGCSTTIANNTVFGPDDLMGKKIGVQLGTTGDDFVTKSYTNEKLKEGAEALSNPATVERFNRYNDCILALQQGKLDAVVMDIEPAKVFISKNSDIKILDEALTSEEYAACFQKNSPIKDAFNAAYQKLYADGVITKIIANYIGDDTGSYQYTTPADCKHDKGKLTMYTESGFEPYEYIKGGKIVGIDVDIATAVCDAMGYELEIEDILFDSIIAAVSEKEYAFGMAGMTVDETRLKSVDFSDPYTTAAQVLVVRVK